MTNRKATRASSTTGVRGTTVLLAHPGAELYGSDRMLLESASALLDEKARVVVALPSLGPLADMLTNRGAEVIVCRTGVLRKSALSPVGLARLAVDTAGGMIDAWRAVTRFKPQRIYVSTLTIPLWIGIARLRRVPVVAHVHEAESSAPGLQRAALAAPLLAADTVIANSEFSVEVLGDSFNSLGRRTTVVHNGVPGPSRPVQARKVLDSALKIAYVGRLSPRKGVDVAIEAVRLLTEAGVDVRLTLIGTAFSGYEWYEQLLRRTVTESGLSDRVAFLGFQSPVFSRITEADVVVVPSRVDEPFGNTAVEALLCGRPVIASATSGLLEATAGYRSARTVAPGDATSLARSLAEVASNWQYMRTAAWRDVALAEHRHSPSTYRHRVAATLGGLPPRRWKHHPERVGGVAAAGGAQ
ncbi:glycosyltransferase [Salinibacterium hongtaonis]|uniref:Glycosyltransferase family 1 protein n=1 Tax=Homoserinimonas hongtaonis TaxID=2079791 RepID=A0A2U1T125_9MICO|nr:glycosyltransferase [Salinibacterium hongtaonis]AWB90114.1 glycosyl transferase family 1 [Salinibacterium hongtaonis]PWB97568.1 glycosyltransferase family 1 protein [Salinibacterium hongtaonis]